MKIRDELDEFRQMEEIALRQKLEDLQTSLLSFSFRRSVGQLDNSALIGQTKRSIARVKTVLNEKG